MMLRAAAPGFAAVGEGKIRPSVWRSNGVAVVCKGASNNQAAVTGVVFEPFEELKVKREMMLVPTVPQDSLARQKFSFDCEAAINEQIK